MTRGYSDLRLHSSHRHPKVKEYHKIIRRSEQFVRMITFDKIMRIIYAGIVGAVKYRTATLPYVVPGTITYVRYQRCYRGMRTRTKDPSARLMEQLRAEVAEQIDAILSNFVFVDSVHLL